MQIEKLDSKDRPKGYLITLEEGHTVALIFEPVQAALFANADTVIASAHILDSVTWDAHKYLLQPGDIAFDISDDDLAVIQITEDVITSQSWPVALGDSSHKILLGTPLKRKRRDKFFVQYPPVSEAVMPPEEFGDTTGTTRSEKAWSFWESNWYKVLKQYSPSQSSWILHIHARGLTDDETDMSLEDLLKTSHSVHMDLRLELPSFWFGFTLMTGTTESNRSSWKISKLNGTVLQAWPKYVTPKEGIKKWLTLAKDFPVLSPPGGVGATSEKWAKFWAYDTGSYSIGVANRSFVELFLNGTHLDGRYLFQKAESDKRRFWILRKPSDQTPYADTHGLTSTMTRLKQRGHRQLLWPSDGRLELHSLSDEAESMSLDLIEVDAEETMDDHDLLGMW